MASYYSPPVPPVPPRDHFRSDEAWREAWAGYEQLQAKRGREMAWQTVPLCILTAGMLGVFIGWVVVAARLIDVVSR